MYKNKRNEKAISNFFISTFLQEMLKTASVFMASYWALRGKVTYKRSKIPCVCLISFTNCWIPTHSSCLLSSMVWCSNTAPDKNWENWSQVSMLATRLEFPRPIESKTRGLVGQSPNLPAQRLTENCPCWWWDRIALRLSSYHTCSLWMLMIPVRVKQNS
jgi:hypothetical protein